ncbi:DUF6545 domain-containing protein [Actinacidiphila sp. bgisy144]|uniref:DUF6545 domain-containing protein n=1 Tax=Actinacidiphila sp. bgisy144 TaxID=3413791 RepID=UPI003EBDA24E
MCVHLTLEPAQARRLVRINLALLSATVLGMTTLFTYRQTVHDSPQAYALYVLLYISYLSYAILALRPYRSQQALVSAQRAADVDAYERDALVEAAAVNAALTAMRAGHLAQDVEQPRVDTVPREDLREDTEWLVRVAAAYTRLGIHVRDDAPPEPAGV